MSTANRSSGYGLEEANSAGTIPVPAIDYLPSKPKKYSPPIGVIGAGGISAVHLRNYRLMGLNVVAIADINREAAAKRRDEFFPAAEIFSDARELLKRPDIEVVDLNLHPSDRLPLIEEALLARKHVLSQKPFVLDLAEGRRLVDLAEKLGVKLAVNQNGRWAPHFSFLRQAIAGGLIGEVVSADFTALFDHRWIGNIPSFDRLRHMLLYDFAIHWFDILNCLMNGQKAERVYAAVRGFSGQSYRPPSLAAAVVDYAGAQARLGFNAHAAFGQEDTTILSGTDGLLRARGPGLNQQSQVEIFNRDGKAIVPLEGEWFLNGFQGTMSELLCAIEENREPSISARNNLGSLELCFAALASADSGLPVVPGKATRVENLYFNSNP